VLWLGWYFPRLPLEVFGSVQSEQPLAVSRRRKGSEWIDRCNEAARCRGIRPGMSLPAAFALLPELRVRARDRQRERRALESLGHWGWCYSSRISFDPLLVLLEVGGSLSLFGGFQELVARMLRELPALGYAGQWGAAPTPSAAALLARVAPATCIDTLEELASRLAPVPLRHFTRNRVLLDLMRNLGLESIGDCLRLPRPELVKRVGSEPTLLLDRLLGQAPEPRSLWQPAKRFSQRLPLLAEIEQAQALQFPAQRLLASLCAFLHGRDGGAQQLEWRLLHRDAPDTVFRQELLEPSRDARHMLELLRHRLERLVLPQPVVEMELKLLHWQPLPIRQDDLFEVREKGADNGLLLERLRAHLGATAVQGVELQADHRPERAWRYRDPAERGGPDLKPAPCHRHQPLWLLPTPRRLSMRQGRPFHEGPLRLKPFSQRIETGWWEKEEDGRDYYQAVNPAGERLWVYRERNSGKWFLHGFFD